MAEAADVTGRIAPVLRKEVEAAGQMPLYEQIDLPLVPVLVRMEQAGVKIDRQMLGTLSVDLEKQCDDQGARDPRESRASRSTSIRPSSWATCSLTSSTCPSR